MSIPHQEAADALRNIEEAQQHSAKVYHYQRFSPHLFLWGAIWIVGYAANYFWPAASLIWVVLVAIGLIGSFFLGGRATSLLVGPSHGRKYAVTAVAIFLFISAVFAILPPRSQAQVGAFLPVLVALFYALVGIWTGGTRIALLALALGALTIAGYFWLPEYFLLWMAGVGGGALTLGGVWLRRI